MAQRFNLFQAQQQPHSHELEYCAFFDKDKHAEYDFLSNFHLSSVVTPFGIFRCSEGLYQYHKFMHLGNPELAQRFMQADGPEAYRMSRELERHGQADHQWDKHKEYSMRETLRSKFADETLKQKLLATKSAYLVENGPNGHDPYWSDAGNGSGQNHLGRLLMELRAKLGGAGVVPRPAILDLFYERKCDHCTNCCHFTNKGMFYNYCDAHMTHELKLGNYSKQIHLSDIPEGTGRFLYFRTNEDPELVEEGTRLIAERILALGLANPYFVTPAASTTVIAHELRTKYGIPGTVVEKSLKPTDLDMISIQYSAITSKDVKALYLTKDKLDEMRGRDIVIFDNVCTTGETIKATYNLLLKAGVHCDKIKEAIVLFTEGEDAKCVHIADHVDLPLHRFSYIPLFPTDPSVDKSKYRMYSAATIPTKLGQATLAVFHDRTGSGDKDAIAFYPPSTFKNGRKDIVVRVHDACATSELFSSVKCDCKKQLKQAKKYVMENGGIIIYLNQEGRGIGLGNKMMAYKLQQEEGLDTVQANRALGLPDDARQYEAVRDILKSLNVESVRLLTNNPRKVGCLKHLGIEVTGTVPCVVTPSSPQMLFYMQTKAAQMGHTITFEGEVPKM